MPPPRARVCAGSPISYIHKANPRLVLVPSCFMVANPRVIVEESTSCVGLWRSWERASMAWKRSSVRTRLGPPNYTNLSSSHETDHTPHRFSQSFRWIPRRDKFKSHVSFVSGLKQGPHHRGIIDL